MLTQKELLTKAYEHLINAQHYLDVYSVGQHGTTWEVVYYDSDKLEEVLNTIKSILDENAEA